MVTTRRFARAFESRQSESNNRVNASPRSIAPAHRARVLGTVINSRTARGALDADGFADRVVVFLRSVAFARPARERKPSNTSPTLAFVRPTWVVVARDARSDNSSISIHFSVVVVVARARAVTVVRARRSTARAAGGSPLARARSRVEAVT